MNLSVTKEQPNEVDVEGGSQKESAPGENVLTDPNKGLTSEEVERQREIHGMNETPAPHTPSHVLFLRQFVGFLPFLIEIAAIVALAVRD